MLLTGQCAWRSVPVKVRRVDPSKKDVQISVVGRHLYLVIDLVQVDPLELRLTEKE